MFRPASIFDEQVLRRMVRKAGVKRWRHKSRSGDELNNHENWSIQLVF